MKFITCLSLLVLCSSCASPVRVSIDELNSIESCCASMREFNYDRADYGYTNKTKMHLGNVYSFKEGKSFYLSLEMKNKDNNYLEIITYLDGDWVPTSQVFLPKMITLDETFNIVRDIDNLNLRKGYLFASFEGETWGNIIELNSNEKYIIIYSNANSYGKPIYLDTVRDGYAYSTGGGSVVVPSTSYTDQYSKISTNGTIKLKLYNKKEYLEKISHNK